MARPQASIVNQITVYLQANYGQVGQVFYYYFNDKGGNPITPSKTSAIGLIISIVAWSINFLEQIMDTFTGEVESIIAAGIPETEEWIRQQAFNFQYSATNPQVIQLNPDFSISYPVVDPSLRIINNCAVVGDGNGGVKIKVTSNAGLLTGPQSAAFASYLDAILGGDINYSVINANPDTLDIFGTVYYNGQYAGNIVATVTAAVNAYLTSLGFNGIVKLSDLIDTIRTTPGVTDFQPSDVYASPFGGTPQYLVKASNIQTREYQTNSGQIAIDGGNPLSTSLTFSIDNN